jgi:hypothetical protein
LDYSSPYAFDGFALLSRRGSSPDLLASFGNSADIVNVGLFILLIIHAVGWLAYAVELRASADGSGGAGGGGTVGRWVYWSITTFSSVGFGGALLRCAFVVPIICVRAGAYRRAACVRADAFARAGCAGVRADVVPMSSAGRMVRFRAASVLRTILAPSLFSPLTLLSPRAAV